MARATKEMTSALSRNMSYRNQHRSAKTHEKLKWEIRKELSRKTDENGDFLYPDYTNRSGRKFVGAHAVPWSAVEEELARREEAEAERELMKAQGLAHRKREHVRKTLATQKWDAISDTTSTSSQPSGVWANGTSAKVLDSNFTVKKAPSKTKIAKSTRKQAVETGPRTITLDIKPRKGPSSRSKVEDAIGKSKLFDKNSSLANALGDLASEQSRIRREDDYPTFEKEDMHTHERAHASSFMIDAHVVDPPLMTKIKQEKARLKQKPPVLDGWGTDSDEEETHLDIPEVKPIKSFNWADDSEEEDGW